MGDLVERGGLNVELALLTHGILTAHGHEADPAMVLLARQVAAAIPAGERVPHNFVAYAVLLDRLGYGTGSWLVAPAPVDAAGLRPMEILSASRERIRRMCSQIASATAWGAVPCARTYPRLSDLLLAVSMQSLSAYDLEFGATVLRTVTYLGAGDPTRMGVIAQFLADQQCEDGSIGFFGIEAAKIAQRGEALCPAHQLSLPTTVGVLWALKEVLRPGSNVFRDFSTPVA
ncbi:hypothetical protein [Geodermatophilus pulveris]|nr:hypothetical protein [Geodermatophilus pulveris]